MILIFGCGFDDIIVRILMVLVWFDVGLRFHLHLELWCLLLFFVWFLGLIINTSIYFWSDLIGPFWWVGVIVCFVCVGWYGQSSGAKIISVWF